MRERRERGGGGRDGNCFRQRQWGAIRVIKLISRTNKERERERERGLERRRDREIDLMIINRADLTPEENSEINYSYFLPAVGKNTQQPL